MLSSLNRLGVDGCATSSEDARTALGAVNLEVFLAPVLARSRFAASRRACSIVLAGDAAYK